MVQTIRITDSAPPTIDAMSDLELMCDSPTGNGKTPKARLALNTPVVTDNADPSPSWQDSSPAEFNVSKSCVNDDGCFSEQHCDTSWTKCSDTGVKCAVDADCAAGTCDVSPTCVTQVIVMAIDMGGLSATASYDVAVVNSPQLTLDVGPTELEILNATGLALDANRRCTVPADVLSNPANYIKDYDSSSMTPSSEGTWVSFRMPQVRGLCSAGSTNTSVDHDYPKTKTSGFISSETETTEKLLTLCLPHNTNNANGAPEKLVSQITWDVLEDNLSRGEDCSALGPGQVCPRTIDVSVYNTGYLVMLTDYTGKRNTDSIFTSAATTNDYPFVKSEVCNPQESMCGSALVSANNWYNHLQSTSQAIAWKVAHANANYAPVWSEQSDTAASWHAKFAEEDIYCPLSITAQIPTAAGTLKAFGRLSKRVPTGSETVADYACFGVDKTSPVHSFTLSQLWHPSNSPKMVDMVPTNPNDLNTYPHYFTGENLPLDIAASDQGGIQNGGLQSIQVVLTNMGTSVTQTVVNAACTANAFSLTGPMGGNPITSGTTGSGLQGDSCTPASLCDAWPEACVVDPYSDKLSLDLGVIGRGHHKLTVSATDMAGNVDSDDFYLKVVDLNDELVTWTGWLQGYANGGDNNIPVLTALAGIQRAKNLFLNAPTQAMLQVKDVWGSVKDAFDSYGVDTYIMSAALPKGLFNESRRIAEAHYDANQQPWSLYDNGGFRLPCTEDSECFASGESTLNGACAKKHADAAKGYCQIGSCATDDDCSWTYGDRCVMGHGQSTGYCAVAYAMSESPYFQPEGYSMVPARYLSSAFARNKAAYEQLKSNTTLAVTTAMNKSIETVSRLAPLYQNRIYSNLYGQNTVVVRDYDDYEMSYGYACAGDSDCSALPGGFCQKVGNNEQGICKRQEGSFGNGQRGSLSFGGDMGAQIASSVVAQMKRVKAAGVPAAVEDDFNEVVGYLEDFAYGVAKNGCVYGYGVCDSSLILYGNLEAVIRIYLNGIAALEKLDAIPDGYFETRRWRLGVMNTMLLVMNHSMYEGQVATYYAQKPGIPIEFEGAQVGGPFKDRDPLTNTYSGGTPIPNHYLVIECLLHRIAHHLTRNELDVAVELFKNAKCLYVDFYNDKYGAVSIDNRSFNIDDRCLEHAAENVGEPGYNWTSIFAQAGNFWGCPVSGVHDSGCQKVDLGALNTGLGFDPNDEPGICGANQFDSWTACEEKSCVLTCTSVGGGPTACAD
jgi:hypothetical protein